MPIQQSIILYIRKQITICIKIITPLIYFYHGVKQLIDSSHFRRHSRHHRHPNHRAQRLIVKLIAFGLQFVIHIQCYHHAHVHVNQLRRKEHITLQVARVYHIHHHIRMPFHYLTAHISLLWRVCRQRICTRQIHQTNTIPLILKFSLFRINRHPRIVTHLFVFSRNHVEQRCLASIRISHQCHLYLTPTIQCHLTNLIFSNRNNTIRLKHLMQRRMFIINCRLLTVDC